MSYQLMVVAGNNELLRAIPQHMGDGVEVHLFDSANDALWNIHENPPDALIAEIDLPGMSGIELAEIIPNFELPTRVVLWGEQISEPDRHKAEACGVHRLLLGPLNAESLQATLQEAFQAAAQIAAQAALAPEPAAEPVPAEASPEPAPEPKPVPTAQSEPAPAPAPEPEAPTRTARRNFTPARVTLPPVSERGNSTRPPAERLSARARRAAPSRVAEVQAEPATEETAQPRRSTSGTLIVTADNINPIRSIMSQLAQDLGAQSILLADRAGMVLVDVGTTDNLPMMIVLPLLSTSFSTAGEIARQLREEDATNLYIHDGTNYDLYCFAVLQRYLLVLVFNKKVASAKIGAVWVNAKRAIRELREALDR
jgi:CheY-like chemotaxis protein